jgi:RNA polymerase sigma factor (sigma-70 family)
VARRVPCVMICLSSSALLALAPEARLSTGQAGTILPSREQEVRDRFFVEDVKVMARFRPSLPVDRIVVRADERIERLYREEGHRLWWAVVAYSGDRDVADDAVAEAFTQALGRGDELRSPVAWVWKAAFRIAAGELKRRGRQGFKDVEASYEMPEPVTEVLDALRKLSARQRAVIVLHYLADYPTKDIAKILGSTTATVDVHLHRARKRLRNLLETSDE